MFTDPNHIRVEDPGQTENNPVFMYLDAFATDAHFEKFLPEYKNLEELKAHYQRGGLGDVKVKKFLASVMEDTLAPMRERRAKFENQKDYLLEILKRDTEYAKEITNQTLQEVRSAIGLNYFTDNKL